MSEQTNSIPVDAIVTVGATASQLSVGEKVYTGAAIGDLGEYLTGNTSGVSVVVDNYTHNTGSIRNLTGVEITGGEKVIFSNNSFTNGGAIHFTGKKASTLSGVTFSSNNATNYGGALYNAEGILTVSNVVFDHNYAGKRGGAIQSLNAKTTVNDSVFTGNTAAGDNLGGAINNYSNDSKTGVVTINGCTFSENSAVDGAAIVNTDILDINASQTTGKDTYFINNTAGFAIMNCLGGTIYIGNATFDGNIKGAIDNRNSTSSQTGTLQNTLVVIDGMLTLKTNSDTIKNGSVIKIDGDAFLSDTQLIAKVINNPGQASVATLTLDGEGLSYEAVQLKSGSDILVMKSGLELNSAIVSADGGICQSTVGGTTYYSTGYSSVATALSSDFNTVILDGCTHNSGTIALGNGDKIIGVNGALISGVSLSETAAVAIAAGNTVSISGMTFADNVTSGNAPGVISAAAAYVTVSNTLFANNRSNKERYGYGGAIRNIPVSNAAPSGMFTILGSTFTNSHSTNGGAIFNSNIMTIGKGADGKDTLFCNSSGDYAILNCTGGTLTIGNVTFDGNTKGAIDNRNQTNSASGTPCLIVVNGLITLKTDKDTIRNSGKMRVDGAGFISGSDTAFAKVIDANNSGWLSGNAIGATDGYKTFTGKDNDLYVTNAANVAAAAVVSGSKTGIITVGDTLYNGNGYDSFGEAIAAESTIVVDNYTYSDGQIVMDKNLTVTGGKNALFANNIANGVAGAVFQKATRENINLNISGVTFSGNQAPGKNAGVIQHIYGGTLTLKDVLFDGNSANHGGTMQVGSSADVDNVTFINNSVTGYGGAFYNAEGKDVVVSNSYFGNNSAVNRGGAMHLLDGVVAINDCIFENNSVTTADTTNHGFGGAINQFSSSDHKVKDGLVTISGGTFADNSAKMGSAIATTWDLVIQASKKDGSAVLFRNNYGSAAILVTVSGGTHCTTISDAIFDGNDGAIKNLGIVSVKDTVFKTASDTIDNAGTLTFNGNIMLNASLTGNGTYTVDGANFTLGEGINLNGVDFSNATITVDGTDLAAGDVIATNIGGVGKYVINNKANAYLELAVVNDNLVAKELDSAIADNEVISSFSGTGTTVISGGTVNTFIGQKTSDTELIANKIDGGQVDGNLIGGAFAKAADLAENTIADIGKTELNIGGEADVKGQVYAGGYFYGTGTESTEAQMTVNKVNIKLDGNAKVNGNLFAGIHARAAANVKVNEISISINGGEHDRVYAGGWAEGNAKSTVGASTVNVSGGYVDYIYGGGANGQGETHVGATTITVGANAKVGTIFMSGRYGYSSTGAVELNWYGQNDMKRLSGVSSAGIDNADSTTVKLFSDLTVDGIDFVDKFVFAEGVKLTANVEFLLGDRVNGESSGATIFDFTTDGLTEAWDAIAGISDFEHALFSVNGKGQTAWTDTNAALVINGYELSYNDTEKTVTLKQLA